jgi:hypothetical protein
MAGVSRWEAGAGPALCRLAGNPPNAAASRRSDRNTTPIEGKRIMPRLDLGAVRATCRAALRRLDTWTLSTMNSPAGGRRPRL